MRAMCCPAQQAYPHTVEARRILYRGGVPTLDAWKPYPVRTLADLKLAKKAPTRSKICTMGVLT